MIPTFVEYCRSMAENAKGTGQVAEGLLDWIPGFGKKPAAAPARKKPSHSPDDIDYGVESKLHHGDPRSNDLPPESPFAKLGGGSRPVGGMERRPTPPPSSVLPDDFEDRGLRDFGRFSSKERQSLPLKKTSVGQQLKAAKEVGKQVLEPRLKRMTAVDQNTGRPFEFYQGRDGGLHRLDGTMLRGHMMLSAKEAMKKYHNFAASDDWDGEEDIHNALDNAEDRGVRGVQLATRMDKRQEIIDRERDRMERVRQNAREPLPDEDRGGTLRGGPVPSDFGSSSRRTRRPGEVSV